MPFKDSKNIGAFYSQKNPQSIDDLLETFQATQKNPGRDYKHVESLFEDIRASDEQREQFISDYSSLKSIFENKKEIAQFLSKMIEQMPKKQKELKGFAQQIEVIQNHEIDIENITLNDLQNLKITTIMLKKGLQAVKKGYAKLPERALENNQAYKKALEISEEVTKIVDLRLFKEGHRLSMLHWSGDNQAKRESNPDIIAIYQQAQFVNKLSEISQQQDVYGELYFYLRDNWKWRQGLEEQEKQHAGMQSQGYYQTHRVGPYRNGPQQHRSQRNEWKHLRLALSQSAIREKQEKELLEKQLRYQQQCSLYFIPVINQNNITINVPDTSAYPSDIIEQIEKKQKRIEKSIVRDRRIQAIMESVNAMMKYGDKLILTVLGVQNATKTATQQMSNMFENMFSPIGQLLATINLQVSGLVMQSQVMMPLIELVMQPVQEILDIYMDVKDDEQKERKRTPKGNDYKKESRKGALLSILKMAFRMQELVIRGIQVAFTVIATVISSGVQLFTSILEANIKLLKTIVKTSALMESIMNILNLVLIMFFMPFFNEFGNTLLQYIFDLLLWQQSFNQAENSDLMKGIISQQMDISDWILENKENIIYIAKNFMSFLPDLLGVFVKMMDFVLYMEQVFIDNYELFKTLLDTGIEAQKEMLYNRLLELTLAYGIAVMNFIIQNDVKIVSALKRASNILSSILDLLIFVVKYFEALCIQVGAQIGGYIGFVLTVLPWGGLGGMMGVFKLFLGSGYKKQVGTVLARNVGSGAGIGAIIGELIYSMFFRSFEEGGYIPATPGGMLVLVAEKETEYIIPESKIHMIRGHNNLVIEVNGDVFAVDDPKSQICEAIDNQQNYARFR